MLSRRGAKKFSGCHYTFDGGRVKAGWFELGAGPRYDGVMAEGKQPETEKTGAEQKDASAPQAASEPCERCGGPLDADGLCPACDEPAPKWMVYLVYALVALFLIGLVYRLIFP